MDLVSREKESVLVLRECKRCGYVACTCVWNDHAEACSRRRAVLDENPKPCSSHDVVACAECWPCSCGKAAELAKWLERERSKNDRLIEAAAKGAAKGKEAA
jgi:hypothetical protein